MICRLLIASAFLSVVQINAYANTDVKRALIIGNNAYKGSELKNSVNDAKAIATSLKKLGFSAELLLDANKKDINSAIDKLIADGEVGNTVSVLYYSGHGLQFQDRNWMLGVDIRGEKIEDEAVDVQAFLSRFKPPSGSITLVILDACREYIAAAKGSRGLAPLDAPPGTLIAFSTAPGRIASDGEGSDKNGVYTKYLLKYIGDQGTPVEGVFKKVRIDVINETDGTQIPWENSSLTRDFYFAPAPPGYIAQQTALINKPPLPKSVTAKGQGDPKYQIAPVDRLSQLYFYLSKIRKAGNPDDIDAVNGILSELTGFTFSDNELQEMAKSVINVGASFAEVPIYSRELLGLSEPGGVLFLNLTHGLVTQRAGAREGDILLRVNGRKISGMKELQAVADQLVPGETVYATVFRNKSVLTLSATLERASVEDLVFAAAGSAMTAKEHNRARDLLKWTTGRNHAESWALLSNLTFNGLGGTGTFFGFLNDYESGFRQAQAAANLGSVKGNFWMTIAYLKGLGVKQSFERANELRHAGATEGAAWALAGLGIAYLQGQGVEKDFNKSRQYLQQAAAQGHFDGLYGLGSLYEEGLGVKRDPAQAILWYERALETGNESIKADVKRRLRKLKQ